MSTGDSGPSPSDPGAEAGRQPTEDELRAAYEAEIKQIRVEQIVLEQIITLINLGMRRTGLSPGTEDERDLDQVRLAIDAIRVQLPLIEQGAPAQLGAIRDALSQLQMAYVRLGGTPTAERPASAAAPAAAGAPPARPDGTAAPGGDAGGGGPAQSSGRLWIPGQ